MRYRQNLISADIYPSNHPGLSTSTWHFVSHNDRHYHFPKILTFSWLSLYTTKSTTGLSVEITAARYRGLPMITTGTAASSFQLPLQPVKSHHTTYKKMTAHSRFVLEETKITIQRWRDGKKERRYGVGVAARICTAILAAHKQLVRKSMNYCSWYRSKSMSTSR